MSFQFGLIVIGDEILSGKRIDKHLCRVIELLRERGLSLAWSEYVGDDAQRITATLRRAFASGDVVFCTGGIGATPDDHTRECAAQALGVPAVLHPEAQVLIDARIRRLACENGEPYEPTRADNQQRLKMGVFPSGAHIIPNPYNQIPGFFCAPPGSRAAVYFVPGFSVMAWPMIAWVLDTFYADFFHQAARTEHSVVVFDSQEALLTPLMEALEREHPEIAVFCLPSVDHPMHGRHIELGVKGPSGLVAPAWEALLSGLHQVGARLGPEMVRSG
ncbi:MAG: competence/damage-inducible protein A [Simplicispira suum]|uniref:competence/damage-inducible protein A n=1 Tax=Simplicispira suum TaxID=2109915 RepID=UPI001C6B6DD7|nr:molybdopterin-binding protein [Simplicispira suum]MBW7834736.1 competence/damage-inducible protein A [Simplicispira suum]